MKYIFKHKITGDYLAKPSLDNYHTMNIDEFFILESDHFEALKDYAKVFYKYIVEDYNQKLRKIKLNHLDNFS